MAIPSRQIGWGTESNLLWQILKQLTRLTSVLFALKQVATPKYKIYEALISQSGGLNPLLLTSGAVEIGVTYRLLGVTNGSDFSNVGGPGAGQAVDDIYFIATNSGVPISYGGGSLYYDTGAPIVNVVLENTIGNIWFIYNQIGAYTVKSDGLFTQNKTVPWIGSGAEGVTNGILTGSNYASVNSVEIYTVSINSSVPPVPVDDELNYTPIQIKVYN